MKVRLEYVSRACHCGPRTVYRWAIGESTPRQTYRRPLMGLAKRVAVPQALIDAYRNGSSQAFSSF